MHSIPDLIQLCITVICTALLYPPHRLPGTHTDVSLERSHEFLALQTDLTMFSLWHMVLVAFKNVGVAFGHLKLQGRPR